MTYGCGNEECVDCYPLIYRCEHGTDFPEPVPNGQPVPDCEELGCEDEGGHSDGDGCATYYSEHSVTRVYEEAESDQVYVGDLEPGDTFEENDSIWRVNEVTTVGPEVHIDLEYVGECE
ncbi:hypothetical protein [Micromonospora maritima]|uniref:hypothetical protein n=1 Tax=Micromonospora maritima TaxID=986711 RepID=UPI00157DDE12|nr:hypothetical protein [Micromonospora maritima]